MIVPEQFTMQTQKTLVEMHPGEGILNIDVLSFERLAYRSSGRSRWRYQAASGRNRKKHGVAETGTAAKKGIESI
ncbi:MAG: hypothetical protein ACLUTA_00475 [Blautia wexlerae]